MRILIVEDATNLRTTLKQALTRLGHAVDDAADGNDGESLARTNPYDVMVLDRMLPGKDGLHVLCDLRRDGISTPVLLLTALSEVEDKVSGLGVGADDYMTKPFSLAELAARLEALARRSHGQADSSVRVGPLLIDLAKKSVLLNGEPVMLTAREFSVLECLARSPGRVFSRGQIESRIYAELDSPLSNAVDAAVYSLRRKLCPPGGEQLIHTRRGLGYVLESS